MTPIRSGHDVNVVESRKEVLIIWEDKQVDRTKRVLLTQSDGQSRRHPNEGRIASPNGETAHHRAMGSRNSPMPSMQRTLARLPKTVTVWIA